MESPAVIQHSWGEIIVEGYPPFKDVKLYPGGARAWDWNETGTRHGTGIQPSDVAELIEHGARVIILSRGIFGRLRINEKTIKYLQERNIAFHSHRTATAIALYNKLRIVKSVGALLHSTC